MRRWIFTCLLVLALVTLSFAGDSSVSVPAGHTPVLDGRLGADEWRGAHRLSLAPEGEVFVRRDDAALYVGVRLLPSCIPSLAVVRDGRVHVLHASASLGTAVGTGTKGEAEYRIERRLLEGETPRLAVVACRLDAGRPLACTWPADLADATTNGELLMGSCPTALEFDPEAWTRLELGPTGTPEEQLDCGLDDVEKTTGEDPAGAYVLLLDLLAKHPVTEGEAVE